MLKPVDFDVLIANIKIAVAFYEHIRTPSNKLEQKSFSASGIANNKDISKNIKKQIFDSTDESVEIRNEQGTRRIEIVNNRFMKQYWVLEE